MEKRVCIIGVGPSGITALKNLVDEGLQVVAYDRNQEVGGNWIFTESESHSSVFETTHIISSKTLSQYADFTFDDFDPSVPDYPSHRQLAAYFQAYARQFDLYRHIEFETEVLNAQRKPNGGWILKIRQQGIEREEEFSDLVVCNGHHWNPRMPQYPGSFSGQFLHSHQYKKAAPFAGQRVLVIGGGNSACDVAVETSRVSAQTDISWRRGYRIIPKFVFGKPSDIVASRFSKLPMFLRRRMAELMIRVLVGKNSWHGLQDPENRFGATHPTINEELLYRVRHGKVNPRIDIARLDGNTVHFKDGSQQDYDVIIACTGYIITHPFFQEDFINYREGPVPLYLKMLHPEYADLFFIGLFQPLGCIWPGAELQSKIMARQLAGKWQRPANIKTLVERELRNPHFEQIKTPRHTITVDYHLFVKELLRELPKDYIRKQRPAFAE
ncbi:MAG: NAD(P)-binding domain-containing protein [Bacteroidota bacterium]